MEKHEENEQFSELGFFFYDVIHIVTAVIILVTLFATKAGEISSNPLLRGEFAIECINEFAEIILGALLMFFAFFISKNVDVKIERFAYTFAYVIASIALLLPSISNIVDVIVNSGRDVVLPLLQIIFPLGAMFTFSIALFQMKNRLRLWSRMLLIGMACMLLSGAADIIEIIIELIEGEEFEWIMIVEFIALLAPILPMVFGVRDLKRQGFILNKTLHHEAKENN